MIGPSSLMPRPSPVSRSRKRLQAHAEPRQKHERSLIPVGMAAILPQTAQRVRHLEDVLLTTLSRWGYQEIIPPTFEYLDVLSAGLEPDLIEKCYKFSDRTTGRILLLRPDVTAQIARIVAMGMVESSLPLRLCYRTTVFRYEPEHAGREREIFQVGAELIGVDDVATDGEIIALIIESLERLGLPGFKISLGHVGFFKALLNRTGMSLEGRKRAEGAASKKDIPKLEEILRKERVSAGQARTILEAPGLYGQPEVLERGWTLAGRDVELRRILKRLSEVYRLLESSGLKDHLLLDLGEFRGFDYYDGIVFDVFAEGLGCELGGGGRYNHLIGRFGRDLPSTGFAFDVDRLFRAMERVVNGPASSRADILLSALPHDNARAFEVARVLREAGARVVLRTLSGSGENAIRSALNDGRLLAVTAIAIVGHRNLVSDEVLVLRDPSGSLLGASPRVIERKRVKIKDLVTLAKLVPAPCKNG